MKFQDRNGLGVASIDMPSPLVGKATNAPARSLPTSPPRPNPQAVITAAFARTQEPGWTPSGSVEVFDLRD